jgi:flavin-dependent dehydrogenase
MTVHLPLKSFRIGIIGGSIAGCACAILLQKLGATVTVFERTATSLDGRGAGITLPQALLSQCVAQDLFDADIPYLPITSRSFFLQDNTKIWTQSLTAYTVNWPIFMPIYANVLLMWSITVVKK